MIAVIFEVWPARGRKDDYLRLAGTLREELETMDGFISIERFASLTDPEKLLSLSDLARRGGGESLAKQAATPRSPGGGPWWHLCRLSAARIAAVVRDYGMKERAEAPANSRQAHEVATLRTVRGQNRGSFAFRAPS